MSHKGILFSVAALFLLVSGRHGVDSPYMPFGCESSKSLAKQELKNKTPRAGTIMQIVRIKTSLSEEELLKKAREREPQFEAIPGIIQKYYIKLGPSEYGGVYIWDSVESLKSFKESELAASIPRAYEAVGDPSVEIVDILFQLRE